MNVEKLLQVKHHILEEPQRLSMGFWIQDGEVACDYLDGYSIGGSIDLFPPCGTAACIAGWACVLNNKRDTKDPEGSGMAILGLTDNQANRLFRTPNWDSDLREKFETTDLKVRAEAAAEMIDRVIAQAVLVHGV